MKRKLLSALVCAVLIAHVSAAAGAATKVSDGVVKIGVLTDMSGAYSDLAGPGSLVAVQMAVADFIAREKPDFKIEVISADHQNKGDIAAIKAREWIDTEKVDMIVDLVTTSTALAVMKVAKEKNRITIVSGAASTLITNEQCTDTNVHWTYDTYALAAGTGKAVVKQGGKTWFFLTADYAFGKSLEKDTTEVVLEEGGKVLGSCAAPVPGPGFLLVPAAGPGVGRPGDRAGQRRQRHHQRHQAGGRVRHHAEADAGRAADVHFGCAQPGAESDPGHVPHHRLLLGPEQRDAGLVEALLREDETHAHHGSRPGTIRRRITT